jgi:hypothetical protein
MIMGKWLQRMLSRKDTVEALKVALAIRGTKDWRYRKPKASKAIGPFERTDDITNNEGRPPAAARHPDRKNIHQC